MDFGGFRIVANHFLPPPDVVHGTSGFLRNEFFDGIHAESGDAVVEKLHKIVRQHVAHVRA